MTNFERIRRQNRILSLEREQLIELENLRIASSARRGAEVTNSGMIAAETRYRELTAEVQRLYGVC